MSTLLLYVHYHVMGHMKFFFYFFSLIFYKVVDLVGGGSVIDEAYPV